MYALIRVCIFKVRCCVSCVYLASPCHVSSIEEDFVTWKEKLWPAVCEYFGLDSTEGSIGRDFALTTYNSLPPEEVFVGEPHKLGSYEIQKA